jgi:toxin-antitoxin system PIN domain toxin
MLKSMKSWLVDINVWLALAYDRHEHHALARQWFEEPTSARFCFCRLTQLGFLRLLINPAVMGRDVRTGRDAWRLYDDLIAYDRVSFVSEPAGFEHKFRELTGVSRTSHRMLPDAYVGALAHSLGYQVASFDRVFRTMPGVDALVLAPPR